MLFALVVPPLVVATQRLAAQEQTLDLAGRDGEDTLLDEQDALLLCESGDALVTDVA